MAVLGYHSGHPDSRSAAVADDRPCRLCGVSLRGQRAAGRCSQCGKPVGATLNGDLYAYADPKWLDRLNVGLHTVVWGTIVGVALAILAVVSAIAASSDPRQTGFGGSDRAKVAELQWTQVGVSLAGLFATALLGRGAWRLTTPDPDRPTVDFEGAGVRQCLRLLVVLAVGAAVVDVLLDFLFAAIGGPRYSDPSVALIYGLLGQLLQAALWLALGLQLSHMARRIPAKSMAAWARRAGWGVALSTVAVAFIAYHLASDQRPRYDAWGNSAPTPAKNTVDYAVGLLAGGVVALVSVVGLLVIAGVLAAEVSKARKVAFALWARPFRPATAGGDATRDHRAVTGTLSAGEIGMAVVTAGDAVKLVDVADWEGILAEVLPPRSDDGDVPLDSVRAP